MNVTMPRMRPSTARIAAWGVLLGLLAVGATFVVINRHSGIAPSGNDIVSRNVRIEVAPTTLRTDATTTIVVSAQDGEGSALSAWEGAALDAWLVRADLTYAEHVRAENRGATSSFAVDLRPTQPGTYKLVAAGMTQEALTIGGTTLSATGRAEDVPPEEQSAGREGYKVVMSTIPDGPDLRADVPVTVTFTVSRTDTPIILDEESGARGSMVAFHENGSLFVRGEPSPSVYLPSPASAAFSLAFPEPGKYRVFFEFVTDTRQLMEARWIEVGTPR